MKKLFFVGRFPAHKEVGGVTTFTYNFSSKYISSEVLIIDLYPAKGKKVPSGVQWLQIEGNIIKRLYQFLNFNNKNDGVYFFNFSSIRSMLLLFFVPKHTKSKWFAIFHNGEQQKNFEKLSSLNQYIIKLGLKKLDALGCLSDRQSSFFDMVYSGSTYKVSPYIPLSVNTVNKKQKNKFNYPILLITGFPTSIYRIYETLLLLEKLWSMGYNFELKVCLYGFDTDGLLSKIKTTIERLSRAKLYMHLDRNEFSRILDSTDLYLRFNSVDSYGLVVAEALDKGIDVLATNVCERYPGAVLVDVDDFDTVYKELIFYFENKKFSNNLEVQTAPLNQIDYSSLIKKLVEGFY